MSTNLEIFNAYNQALIAGDFPGVFETMADDVIWHQPGTHSISGTVVGKVVTNWVSDNKDLIAANVTFLGTRADGTELNMNGIDLFRIEDGKIKEVWLFSSDQAEEDSFWG